LNPTKKTAPIRDPARQREVDEGGAGQRLDNYLLGVLKGVPRSHVYRLIRSGQVRVNGGRAAPSRRLAVGDRVRVPPVASKSSAPATANAGSLAWLEGRIVYEDARLMVLDKPAGLAVHGGSGVTLGCIEALRALRPEIKDLELAHRLDGGTSGCLMIAKRRSALRQLHALLREGRVEKRYLALLQGRLEAPVTKVDAPLVTRRVSGEARVRVAEEGRDARSSFRLLEAYGSFAALLEVAIATGRTHQIRAHAAHLGHPVAGDERYGDAQFNTALEPYGLHRMFLHAHSVEFAWPETGEPFAVSVPLPGDLKAVLTALEDRHAPPADRRRPRAT
jgi:23S rRNA pseudouridine955/2504/2580 synthase